MMQLCSSLLCFVILWWTSSCFGAAVDAPNADSAKISSSVATEATGFGENQVKVVATATPRDDAENFSDNRSQKQTDIFSQDVSRDSKVENEAHSNPRPKRSLAPEDTFTPANRRYRRLTWKRRPWGQEVAAEEADLEAPASLKSSYPESGSLLYVVPPSSSSSSSSSSDINTDNKQNSYEQSDSDNKDCSESFPSGDSPFQDAYSSAGGRAAESSGDDQSAADASQPHKRVDRSLSLQTSELLATAGNSIARNIMKRRRGGRMYDVPQIGESRCYDFRSGGCPFVSRNRVRTTTRFPEPEWAQLQKIAIFNFLFLVFLLLCIKMNGEGTGPLYHFNVGACRETASVVVFFRQRRRRFC